MWFIHTIKDYSSTKTQEAGGPALQLRTFAGLADYPGWFTTTNISITGGCPTSSSDFGGHQACMWYIYIHADKHTH